MRRTIRWLVPVSALSILLAFTPAGAVVLDRDTGFDADDIEGSRFDPDIRSTTRRLARVEGRRVLAIVVRFYERSGGWPLRIRIDARGGPRVDHIMNTFGDDCFVWPKGHRRDAVVGRAKARGDRFVCRVRAHAVSPTKSIRWKLQTLPAEDSAPHGSPFEIDYAPSDRGWYP